LPAKSYHSAEQASQYTVLPCRINLAIASQDFSASPVHNLPMTLLRHPFCYGVLLLLTACSSPDQDLDPGVTALPVLTESEAAGPRLSSGKDGTLVLSWMEADDVGTTLRYSTLADDRWQYPEAVISGKNMFVNWADLPSVIPLSSNHWVAHWLEMAGSLTYSYHVVMSQSFDGGFTWSVPSKPHSDDTPTEHGFVSLFPQDGKVAAIWLDGRKTGNEPSNDPTTSGMTLRGAVIDADGSLQDEQLIDEFICDCCQTDVAVAEPGPVAVYRDRTVDEVRDIHVTRLVDGVWTAGVPLHNDNWRIAGCPVNGPAIAARESTVAAVWFSAADDKSTVSLKLSDDGGASFGNPISIATEGSLGHVDTIMLPDDSVVVSWLQINADGLGSVMARRVDQNGNASAAHPITTSADKRSVPQMARFGNDLVFVWTGSSEELSRIQSARLPTESLPIVKP